MVASTVAVVHVVELIVVAFCQRYSNHSLFVFGAAKVKTCMIILLALCCVGLLSECPGGEV